MKDIPGPTKITLESHDKKHSSELNWDAGLDDILDAFYGLCIAATFHPESILNVMKDWVEEKMDGMEAFKNIDDSC